MELEWEGIREWYKHLQVSNPPSPPAEEEKNIKLRGMLEELHAQKEYSERVIQDLNNKRKQVEMELRHRYVANIIIYVLLYLARVTERLYWYISLMRLRG